MSKLSIQIGLARSGKSTFCKRWIQEGENRVVLSGDDFRWSISNQRFKLEDEQKVRESLVIATKALLHGGYEVMVDETNTTEYHIRELMAISPKSFKAYINHCPIEICKQRAISCGQEDLLPSLDRMWANLQVTLPKIASNKIDIEYEEMGPIIRWIKSGYWN